MEENISSFKSKIKKRILPKALFNHCKSSSTMNGLVDNVYSLKHCKNLKDYNYFILNYLDFYSKYIAI